VKLWSLSPQANKQIQTLGISKHMNQPTEHRQPEKPDATAVSYVEHAREINHIAGSTLKLEKRDTTAIAAKISLGLSLQAAELAGKAMLRALGHSVEQIRREHRNHDLLTLLGQVERELQGSPNQELIPYHHFLLWTPTIDGTKYGNTIAAYFEFHFARGPSAFPRSYFYPDEPVFTGPVPIQAVFVMVEHLIEVAERVVALVEQ
jgi:HEPN domain-containing protein